MQNRMKTHPLSEEQINSLLARVENGVLATVNPDGSPYAVPVHFAYANGHIYIHGLDAGQKVENLRRNARVSFTAYEHNGYTYSPEGKPCGTNTVYESVIIDGDAVLINDIADKRMCLKAIISKYTPQLIDGEMKDSTIEKTAVIEITPKSITGKYY